MKKELGKKEYSFISSQDKDFIASFDEAMAQLGYTSNQTIGSGYCWGKYMIIYTKAGVKSKKSYARIYIRENDIVLRLYFSNLDRHRTVIEQSPLPILGAFTGDFSACEHCHGKIECTHQKHYTLNHQTYEICDGKAFWFFEPSVQLLSSYLDLFTNFYPQKKTASL